MFATDIDLLTLEPNLFADVGWNGQRLISATGTLSGTTLTIGGVDLTASGVEAGCVVLMSGVPLEVIARTSATTLAISLIRWGRTGPAIPPVGLTTGNCEVRTFRPQIAIAHRAVMQTLGLGEGEDAQVTNGADFATFEAALTLYTIYAAASAGTEQGRVLVSKAEQYRGRAGSERTRIAARLDTDSDGVIDATRRPGVIPLVRH